MNIIFYCKKLQNPIIVSVSQIGGGQLKGQNPLVAGLLLEVISVFNWYNWILKVFLSSVVYGLDFLIRILGLKRIVLGETFLFRRFVMQIF